MTCLQFKPTNKMKSMFKLAKKVKVLTILCAQVNLFIIQMDNLLKLKIIRIHKLHKDISKLLIISKH